MVCLQIRMVCQYLFRIRHRNTLTCTPSHPVRCAQYHMIVRVTFVSSLSSFFRLYISVFRYDHDRFTLAVYFSWVYSMIAGNTALFGGGWQHWQTILRKTPTILVIQNAFASEFLFGHSILSIYLSGNSPAVLLVMACVRVRPHICPLLLSLYHDLFVHLQYKISFSFDLSTSSSHLQVCTFYTVRSIAFPCIFPLLSYALQLSFFTSCFLLYPFHS